MNLAGDAVRLYSRNSLSRGHYRVLPAAEPCDNQMLKWSGGCCQVRVEFIAGHRGGLSVRLNGHGQKGNQMKRTLIAIAGRVGGTSGERSLCCSLSELGSAFCLACRGWWGGYTFAARVRPLDTDVGCASTVGGRGCRARSSGTNSRRITPSVYAVLNSDRDTPPEPYVRCRSSTMTRLPALLWAMPNSTRRSLRRRCSIISLLAFYCPTYAGDGMGRRHGPSHSA